MLAAVLHETGGPLVVESVPRPVPGRGDVLVRVRACGLGLTLTWNRLGRRKARLPRIIGHELAGDIVEVGSSVEGFSPGDRVTAYYYLVCDACRWCRRGREDLCEDRRGQIGREIDGGLAEYVRLPASSLCAIPTNLDYVGAAVASDAIATALHVLVARARAESGETVLVVGGGGGVGVHVVQVARLLGTRVIAVDITRPKLDLAAAAGADSVIDATAVDVEREVRRLTAGHGVDVAVELVGRSETLRQTAASLDRGGRLVLVGSYDRTASLAVTHNTLRGEASVLGSQYCTRSELVRALKLVADGRVRPLVTRRGALEEADAMLADIELGALAGRACVVFEERATMP